MFQELVNMYVKESVAQLCANTFVTFLLNCVVVFI